MSNELTIQDVTNMSVAFAKSGFFGYRNASEAFTLMCLAQANGLHPAKAAERYHIIQGRPAMKADAMLAAFQESGGKVRWVKRTDTCCTLHLEHPNGGELDVTWDKARATAAGLWGKSNWKTYPTQMLSARCVSEGVRALYPACLCGMYTPEEVNDFGPAKGFSAPMPEMVEAEPVAEAEQATETIADTEPTTEAEIVTEAEPVEEDRRPAFLNAMKALAKKNRDLYKSTLMSLGWATAKDVPEERMTEVYGKLYKIINNEQEAKNG